MSVIWVDDDGNDVEEVMGAVADALQRWEAESVTPSYLPQMPGQSDELVRQARQLMLQSKIDGNAVIHSTRPGLGPWLIRFQFIMRRLTWWFLEPILQQIRLFQMNAARVLEGLARERRACALHIDAIGELTQRVERLERELAELKRIAGEAEGEEEDRA